MKMEMQLANPLLIFIYSLSLLLLGVPSAFIGTRRRLSPWASRSREHP